MHDKRYTAKQRDILERVVIMAARAQIVVDKTLSYQMEDVMKVLFQKLDEAIDDMEQGRVQTIDKAWEEIDAI